MNNFSTFEIEELFGIKADTLKDWVSREFITPSVNVASGPGTRHEFNRNDLYLIFLFRHLLNRGYSRERASEIIKGLKMEGNACISEGDWFVVSKKSDYSVKHLTSTETDHICALERRRDEVVEYVLGNEITDALVVNLANIRRFVDAIIG